MLFLNQLRSNLYTTNWNSLLSNGYATSQDNDGDMIPNDIEPIYVLNPNNPKTISDYYNDFDYLSIEAEKEWLIGSADNEDWAYPVKQEGGIKCL